jgi:chromosome segregation ATPase
MTTLKQKIDMMGNFRNMRVETEDKLAKSREVEEKLGSKLKRIEEKEEEHKISLARAHLIFEEYKKAFNVLKETLPKKERDALLAKERVRKSNQSLDDIRKKLTDLDKEHENQVKGLEVLQNLEKQLLKQLEEIA